MRSTSLFSLFGVALCMSAAVVACSGDDDDHAPAPQTPSDLGQSCTRTADCKSPYVCIDQVCEKKGTVPNAGAPNEGSGGSTGGTTATGGTGGGGRGGSSGTGGTTTGPVLGGEGESCTRAADCAAGLRCFNQRCTAGEQNGAGGEAGTGGTEPPPAPKLGEPGETCAVSSDCVAGLACLPASSVGVGVCTIVNTGITPTGNDCSAECREAADCCQLPQSVLANLHVKSCADLAVVLDGVDCTNPGAAASACFAQEVYCDCAKNTWSCSEGQCAYTAACENDGFATKGCPTVSRSEKPLVSTCNDGKCQLAAVDPTCSSDSDCDTKGVADDSLDTCSAGECTCYKATHLCYRKCGVDIDCAPGHVCDGKTHVCTLAPECSTNADCQTAHANVNSQCDLDNGVCQLRCETDLDCNPDLDAHLAQVCNDAHVCEKIGCTQDTDCRTMGTTPSVQMFCTPKLTAAQSGGVSSAITAGK